MQLQNKEVIIKKTDKIQNYGWGEAKPGSAAEAGAGGDGGNGARWCHHPSPVPTGGDGAFPAATSSCPSKTGWRREKRYV